MSEVSERRRRLLADYATHSPVLLPPSEGRFHRLLLFSVLSALGLGAALAAIEPPQPPRPAAAATPAPFHWVALPRPAASVPALAETPRPARQRRATAPVDPPSTAAASEEAPANPAPARRVYGVREVYAQGLGAGAGTLLTKRGNSPAGPADSLTATAADLVASGSGGAGEPITTKPVLVHQVKPHYSAAMLAARVSGVVQLRMLVGASGAVETVEVLEDIGYDSGELASAACRQFRFEPAQRGDLPVPASIRLSIRFEFQE